MSVFSGFAREVAKPSLMFVAVDDVVVLLCCCVVALLFCAVCCVFVVD